MLDILSEGADSFYHPKYFWQSMEPFPEKMIDYD